MTPLYRAVVAALTALLVLFAVQAASQPLPSSFPHVYPNLPNEIANFSDANAWQKCAYRSPLIVSSTALRYRPREHRLTCHRHSTDYVAYRVQILK